MVVEPLIKRITEYVFFSTILVCFYVVNITTNIHSTQLQNEANQRITANSVKQK